MCVNIIFKSICYKLKRLSENMYLFSSRCLRKSESCLNSIKYWQSNFGVNLLSEVIPIEIDLNLLNTVYSFLHYLQDSRYWLKKK